VLVLRFTQEQAAKAQRGSRDAATTLSLSSALDGEWVVNATPWPLYPRERDPLRIALKAGWALGSVWKGAEKLTTNGI